MNLLEVKNLNTSFHIGVGTVQAVRGVSFSVAEGESIGIVGESGSGKTQTMLSVMGLLPSYAEITADSMLFNGRELTKLNAKEMRAIQGSEIGMIFQDPMTSLNPLFTVENQLTEPLRIHQKMSKAQARARALELLNLVEIPNPEARLKQYPHEFSGGMRQRVMIAIAIACNPKMVIADEPTTALDVTIQAQILELINAIKEERRLSVIFITHDMGVVANMADRIAVMYAGKIVEYGTADEIFYQPAHPYTWALLASIPDLDTKEKLESIPGTPPNMLFPPKGDAFAPRNAYAMAIDFEEEPPLFQLSPTHYAATWMLHPNAPKVEPPRIVTERIKRMRALGGEA